MHIDMLWILLLFWQLFFQGMIVCIIIRLVCCHAKPNAVTAHFSNKQLLPFEFSEQYDEIIDFIMSVTYNPKMHRACFYHNRDIYRIRI